jgi:hypothetical protein
VSLLAASDLLNRSGVYFMQDKETGSDGSWHSLMDEAQKALDASQQAWKAWLALNPPKDEALVNSYQLLWRHQRAGRRAYQNQFHRCLFRGTRTGLSDRFQR